MFRKIINERVAQLVKKEKLKRNSVPLNMHLLSNCWVLDTKLQRGTRASPLPLRSSESNWRQMRLNL